eukprot:6213983-Pleurochrysis_carterae.AAC.2
MERGWAKSGEGGRARTHGAVKSGEAFEHDSVHSRDDGVAIGESNGQNQNSCHLSRRLFDRLDKSDGIPTRHDANTIVLKARRLIVLKARRPIVLKARRPIVLKARRPHCAQSASAP